ncbi:MFS transporter [Nonomuraea sp. FMUSA5-5]|uniref:MFS transporter n=1 Tax=Nonomuraea composti TaxID=2720023 RepID=A0ABX1B3L9_9ACTN|nr:MFS transporter [Nonomuraea sp. FMUSA5-5]NJP90914.1 MFS transporter [Nonomuraea sp. FMUSA5-5]
MSLPEPQPATTAQVALPQLPSGSDPHHEKVPKRTVFAILITTFGNAVATLMPTLVALPIIVARVAPGNKESALGIALGISAFGGMLLAPVFGALSDRTTFRLGMRRPGMIIGTAITITGLVLLGLAGSLAMVYTAVMIMALGAAINGASHAAMIPDSIPDRLRGRVLGFSTVTGVSAGLIASIAGPMFIDHQFIMAAGATPLFALATLIGVLLYRDRVLDPEDVPRQPLVRTILQGYRFNPRSAPDFAWVWLGRFFVTFGIAFTGSFTIYFLTDHLKVSQAELAPLISINSVLQLGATTVGTIVGSVVVDRVRSRKSLVLVSALLLAAGGVIVAFSTTIPIFYAGSLLLLFAVGLFIPTDGVLVMSALPGGGKSDVAKYMSLIVIADQLPRSIGPVIAPAVIAFGALTPLGGYSVLYLVGGVVAILGGVLVRQVRGVR